VRAFLLVATRTEFLKVQLAMTEIGETMMSVGDGTETSSISVFTADIDRQEVYWVDSDSKKMWSSTLSDDDDDHRLVDSLHLLCCSIVYLHQKVSQCSQSANTGSLSGSVAEWLACWTQARKGMGSNRSRDAVG